MADERQNRQSIFDRLAKTETISSKKLKGLASENDKINQLTERSSLQLRNNVKSTSEPIHIRLSRNETASSSNKKKDSVRVKAKQKVVRGPLTSRQNRKNCPSTSFQYKKSNTRKESVFDRLSKTETAASMRKNRTNAAFDKENMSFNSKVESALLRKV